MNLEKLLNVQIDPIEHTISPKDCMLYGLGIGLGSDPLDPEQLQFVFEDQLKAFPSYSVVIAHPGRWFARPELELDWLKLLHGEQTIYQHQPLAPETTYIGEYRILGVTDKGAEKGSLIYLEKTLTNKATGELTSTVHSTYFVRGDGGQGGSDYVPAAPVTMPEGEPNKTVTIPTSENLALIYRLSGDYNPIHADPAKAKIAGFDRPILHGLCTFGIATRAVMESCLDNQPESLESLRLRFSSPVFPGETIKVDIWDSGSDIHFSAHAVERDKKVLDQGLAKRA